MKLLFLEKKKIKDLYQHFMLHLIKMKYSSRPGDSSDSQHVTFYPWDAWWGVHDFPLLNSRIIQGGKCVWFWQSLTGYFFAEPYNEVHLSRLKSVAERCYLDENQSSQLMHQRELKPSWVHFGCQLQFVCADLTPKISHTTFRPTVCESHRVR